MKIYNRFFLALTCLVMLSLTIAKGDVLAECPSGPSVKIVGDTTSYIPTSIQDAYTYASTLSGLDSPFTLQLAEGIFTENLTLDGGAVIIDGGYNCAFDAQVSTSSVFGSITIADGSLVFKETTRGFSVVSTD